MINEPKFRFSLTFKNRLLHPNRNCSTNTSAYIRSLIIFFIKVSNDFYKSFPKSLLVCTALCSILPVYK